MTQVRAKQVYRAKAQRGYRYIHVDQVRDRDGGAYALAHEVLPSGEKARGWLHGVQRDVPLYVRLTWDGKDWRMPPFYEEVIDGDETEAEA